MAKDEDDDMFGDFKFVSYPDSNQNNNQSDDDWGDFIATPTTPSPNQDLFASALQSQPSNDLKLNHVESGKNLEKTWEKPRGALPLSIFGDEEEESNAVEDSSNEINDLFSAKSVSSARKESSFGSGVSFNDLIGNLYGQQAQNGSNGNIEVENGSNSNVIENSNGVIEQIKVENGSNSNFVEGNGDFDEDDWEFKDAVHENIGQGSDFGVKKEENILASWGIQVESPPAAITTTSTATTTTRTQPSESENQESSEGANNGANNNAHLDDNWFFTSQGNSYSPTVPENGFHFESDVITADIWNTNSLSQPKQTPTENGNNNSLLNGDLDFDEGFGDFKDAFPTTHALNYSPEQKEELKIADEAGVEMKDLSVENGFQGNGKASENDRGALPLSIFSDGKLESEEPLFGQDVFSFKPVTSMKNGIDRQVSNLSLNDIISDLYSQAENIPAVGSTREHTENGFSPAETGLNSNLGNAEDDFAESSWDFKAAFSETKAEYASPVIGLEYIQQMSPTESKILNFMDFYSRLKEESGFLILHHLDELKDAQKVNAHSGEDANTEALDEEFQIAYKKLLQENVVSEDVYSKERTPRNICVNELLAAIEEPKFRVLESEYNMSQKISLAEQNLSSAVALFEHAISVVKILNLGSGEDLFNYTTTWSKMTSACSQELKHGASIWKQSLEKNVQKQILSKSQGQRYILSLGEIYRVAEILRLSATFYKPWILSSLADPMIIFASLEECNAVWSKFGIDNALQSLSNSVGIGDYGSAKALLESIKSIHDFTDFNVLSLGDKVSLPEQTCRLSLLPMKIVPDMETVIWEGEHYFLKLANMWANLISCDPPNLPHIPVNS